MFVVDGNASTYAAVFCARWCAWPQRDPGQRGSCCSQRCSSARASIAQPPPTLRRYKML